MADQIAVETPPPSELSVPSPPPPAPPRATKFEIAAWIFMAAGLLFVLTYHLLAALLAGLLVHGLVHLVSKRIHGDGKRFSRPMAKILALVMMLLLALIISSAVVLVIV